MTTLSFTAEVHKLLSAMPEKCDKLNPDTKSNTGRLIGRAHFWDAFVKYAEAQSKQAWKALKDEEIIEQVDETGTHTLAESPSFSVIDKVSEPRKGFKPEVLATALNKRYKVPKPIAIEMIDAAKVPGNRVHTLTTVQR